ncbi:hypothetical protein RvY_15555 [Ramazzottius varieornatus]|uniref:Large ribosomal subunit protein mL42 n=1 Tax=Ramazzottius varieornatus TaxID=947166 RepID=A0A1D1VWW5_RAMVA|nr:hypothetical protein RvY_15555 [Ramazzottius varieornatus]
MSALASFSRLRPTLPECLSTSKKIFHVPCRTILHVFPPGWREKVDDAAKPTDPESRDHWVLSADQGRTIVCYHPERPFPYEHSLPVPRQESLFNEGDSVLKVQLRKDWHEASQPFNKEGVTTKLAKLFKMDRRYFVPHHRLSRIRRYKVFPVERDGL